MDIHVPLKRSLFIFTGFGSLKYNQNSYLNLTFGPSLSTGTFHSTKIPVWNFGNSMCPMEQYIPVAHVKTWPKPLRIWLLFLQAGYKSAVLGITLLSNGKGDFGRTDWNYHTGQRGPTSKLVPNISVGTNQNGPFHFDVQTKISRIIGWIEINGLMYLNPIALEPPIIAHKDPHPLYHLLRTCPNFRSWYFASGTEGLEAHDL